MPDCIERVPIRLGPDSQDSIRPARFAQVPIRPVVFCQIQHAIVYTKHILFGDASDPAAKSVLVSPFADTSDAMAIASRKY